MKSTTRNQRRYDHRLRDLVRSSGNIEHATRQGVPRSTARGWLRPARSEIISVDVVDMDVQRLQHEVLELRQRIKRLLAFFGFCPLC